jgi:putative acetyltransferase
VSDRVEVTVRDESPGDAAAIHAVHARAFPTPLEARLVDALRDAGAVVVSRVAIISGTIVGHVLFTPVRVDSRGERASVLGLAPIGVVPEHQRRGIGATLLRGSLEHARAFGAGAVVLVGEPDYYARFGFVAAQRFGLRCKWPGTEEAFMALELVSGALAGCSGLVSYHDLFDSVA